MKHIISVIVFILAGIQLAYAASGRIFVTNERQQTIFPS